MLHLLVNFKHVQYMLCLYAIQTVTKRTAEMIISQKVSNSIIQNL